MKPADLLKLALGGLLLFLAAALIYRLATNDQPETSTTSLPDNWSAATRAHISAQHALATEQLDKLQVDAARAILQPLLDRYPSDYQGLNLLAQTYIIQQNWQAAYDALNQSLKLDDRQADTHLVAGGIAERHLRQFQIAQQHYRSALAVDPENTQYLLYMANVSIKLNDAEQAKLASLEALRIDPKLAKAHAILAQALAQQNNLTMALKSIQRARELTPLSDSEATVYFVNQVQWLRRRDAAGRDEALALLLDAPAELSARRDVQEQLARTYESLAQHDLAMAVWSRWLKSHPSDVAAAAEAGLAAHKAGNRPAAEQFLKIATTIKAHHPLVMALQESLNAN